MAIEIRCKWSLKISIGPAFNLNGNLFVCTQIEGYKIECDEPKTSRHLCGNRSYLEYCITYNLQRGEIEESKSQFLQSFFFLKFLIFESLRCALSAYPLEGEIYYNYARTKFSSIFVKLFILFRYL
ncbi:hypothetical protein Avbf_09235 [Armadillidium vulgare]|nr:hypothetical protein Avbf_09235 [Armadillidium vulgare]